jgi:nucleoside-diphosphate-sugar epimerase
MKILVTGSEGSLMQAVIPRLLRQGHEVRGVDNFVRHGPISRVRSYEFVEGDLTDREFSAVMVEGMDGIIQAAARIYGVGGFHKYPADILAHDITLHQNILWAAKNNNIRRVAYISSSMVLERCTHHPSSEADAFEALIPWTDYGLSKLVGERLCMAFQRQFGIEYTIWRPFNIITPYEQAESEQGISHVFADFIANIVVRRLNPLPIIGDGGQVRCFTWIDEVASGIAQHSFGPAAKNEVFHLGNPEPFSMKDLAKIIYEEAVALGLMSEYAHGLTFKTAAAFEDDVRVRIPDVDKAKTALGWTATVKLRDAVRRCLAVTITNA